MRNIKNLNEEILKSVNESMKTVAHSIVNIIGDEDGDDNVKGECKVTLEDLGKSNIFFDGLCYSYNEATFELLIHNDYIASTKRVSLEELSEKMFDFISNHKRISSIQLSEPVVWEIIKASLKNGFRKTGNNIIVEIDRNILLSTRLYGKVLYIVDAHGNKMLIDDFVSFNTSNLELLVPDITPLDYSEDYTEATEEEKSNIAEFVFVNTKCIEDTIEGTVKFQEATENLIAESNGKLETEEGVTVGCVYNNYPNGMVAIYKEKNGPMTSQFIPNINFIDGSYVTIEPEVCVYCEDEQEGNKSMVDLFIEAEESIEYTLGKISNIIDNILEHEAIDVEIDILSLYNHKLTTEQFIEALKDTGLSKNAIEALARAKKGYSFGDNKLFIELMDSILTTLLYDNSISSEYSYGIIKEYAHALTYHKYNFGKCDGLLIDNWNACNAIVVLLDGINKLHEELYDKIIGKYVDNVDYELFISNIFPVLNEEIEVITKTLIDTFNATEESEFEIVKDVLENINKIKVEYAFMCN